MQAHFLAGLLSSFALIVAIGSQNAYVLRQGIRREHLLPIALVCGSADALLIAAGIAGLGALIEAQPAVLALTRYGGAAFLMTYGLFAARRAWSGEALQVGDGPAVPLGVALVTCLAFTFLNPHVYLDTVILLGALANQRGEAGRWAFGGGAVTASLLWFFALAYGARLLAPLFRQPLAWRLLDSLIALTMGGLAASLLLAE